MKARKIKQRLLNCQDTKFFGGSIVGEAFFISRDSFDEGEFVLNCANSLTQGNRFCDHKDISLSALVKKIKELMGEYTLNVFNTPKELFEFIADKQREFYNETVLLKKDEIFASKEKYYGGIMKWNNTPFFIKKSGWGNFLYKVYTVCELTRGNNYSYYDNTKPEKIVQELKKNGNRVEEFDSEIDLFNFLATNS